jgi:hypothetical protein
MIAVLVVRFYLILLFFAYIRNIILKHCIIIADRIHVHYGRSGETMPRSAYVQAIYAGHISPT